VRWSKQGGGSTGGGTLTAGNLVFQVLPNGLLRAYSADQGEQVLEIQTNLGSARASDDFYAGWRAVPNIPGQPRRGGGWLWWRRSVTHHSETTDVCFRRESSVAGAAACESPKMTKRRLRSYVK